MHFVHPSADIQNVVHQTIRSAFENQGQKCSACSRLYVPESLWSAIREGLVTAMKSIKVGPIDDFGNFMSAVIHKRAFDKCVSYIEYAKEKAEILQGGTCTLPFFLIVKYYILF